MEERKPVEVEGVKEWEMEKILNKRKIRGVNKYLVRWKGFTAESDTLEKEEDLKNAKELVNDFEGRVGVEIRHQEGVVEKKREKEEYRRIGLPGKYTAKLLYGWDDKKFEDEYLKKLEKKNNFIFSLFMEDIGVVQGSTLSHPIYSLYCFYLSYLQKRSNNLRSSISVSTLFFINDGLFIS